MPVETIDTKTIIADEIEHRYKLMSEADISTLSAMSIDSMYPKWVHSSLKSGTTTLPRFASTSFAISEYIANETGVRQADIRELVALLGYNEKNIKELILAVKKKKLDIVLIGFGGGNTNFWYWLKQLSSMVLTFNVFQTVHIFDDDTVTSTNILRFPFDTRTNMAGIEKVSMLLGGAQIASKEVRLQKLFDVDALPDNEATKNTIFIGGPDIGTRRQLSERRDLLFYSMTHGGDTISIHKNPEQDESLQVESYGTVELSIFFMNQIWATIKMLEILADTDFSNKEQKEESKEEVGVSFRDVINEAKNNFSVHGKVYRFPIDVKQEEEWKKEAEKTESKEEETK